jgi:hypothetical protein
MPIQQGRRIKSMRSSLALMPEPNRITLLIQRGRHARDRMKPTPGRPLSRKRKRRSRRARSFTAEPVRIFGAELESRMQKNEGAHKENGQVGIPKSAQSKERKDETGTSSIPMRGRENSAVRAKKKNNRGQSKRMSVRTRDRRVQMRRVE